MSEKSNDTSVEAILKAIIKGAQDKKGKELKSLDLRKLTKASTDYYVVCHGQTDRQASAIAKSIEETVFKECGIWPYHSEGYENKEWILLDYFHIVAHIFVEKHRQFFAIEDLWADAQIEEFETIQ